MTNPLHENMLTCYCHLSEYPLLSHFTMSLRTSSKYLISIVCGGKINDCLAFVKGYWGVNCTVLLCGSVIVFVYLLSGYLRQLKLEIYIVCEIFICLFVNVSEIKFYIQLGSHFVYDVT